VALSVEDGSGMANADAYVSLADALTYFTGHGSPAVWTAATEAQKESAIRYATLWIDGRYQWPGTIVSSSQALAWPRSGVIDGEGRSVASDSLPARLVQATCEAALEHLSNALNEILARGGGVQSETVGPISVSYFQSASAGRTFPYIDSLLKLIAYPRMAGIGVLVRA
jgi:hypothetical protein